MGPKQILAAIFGLWLIVAVVVVAYPLRSGQMRVGFDQVRRDSAPRAFWTAYIVSTGLFFAVSLAIGLFVKFLLP